MGKKLAGPHLNQLKRKKLGAMAHTHHPSYTGSINKRIAIQADRSINARPNLKNNQSKKRLEAWLTW
jgi:hypothetical protein